MRPALTAATLSGAAIAAVAGGLAGWWLQSRAREPALTERTRARLRRWSLR